METLRVLTYNVLYGGVGREGRLQEVLDRLEPDVAVFTEVTSETSLKAFSKSMRGHLVISGASRYGMRTAIVSRWPFLGATALGPPWAPPKWIEATIRPFGGG